MSHLLLGVCGLIIYLFLFLRYKNKDFKIIDYETTRPILFILTKTDKLDVMLVVIYWVLIGAILIR